MKLFKHYIFLAMLVICLILFFSSCKNQKDFSNNNNKIKTEKQVSTKKEEKLEPSEDKLEPNEDKTEPNEDVVWDEVTENGVDEELLLKNIDEKTLTFIAQQLQDICTKISEKEKKDKFYWLKGEWYHDVMDSKQYHNVILLENKAMKPLFLIIYKSPIAGLYEWICSKALTDISGFDFSNENNGAGWGNSKEFLEMFIDRVLEQKK
ncbi:MAG: hypothetical protein SPI61_07225 [Ezakiella sp.]|uniref:hypothetical protein n=1 Tax=Ezakiella sp. TaxID=1935205 RepID=UPI0029796942|nr:hypothetical protein [Ezakiella sp.]MDD7731617.1 hypothetical protein [Eubacteriales bacterium]MDY6080497.1 hypothetical protein [Ezakiella sp.]